MLRKILAVLGALCMLFSLAACGENGNESGTGNGSRNAEPYQSRDNYSEDNSNGIIGGIESGINDTISGVESGINDTVSGIENGMR